MTSAGMCNFDSHNIPSDELDIQCRTLSIVASAWLNLPNLVLIPEEGCEDPYLNGEIEIEQLTARSLCLAAGFPIQDTSSPLYQRVRGHRNDFGKLLHRAAKALLFEESKVLHDQTDPILDVIRGIKIYLLEYGTSPGQYNLTSGSYSTLRKQTKSYFHQKVFPRSVWVQRAMVGALDLVECQISPTHDRSNNIFIVKTHHTLRLHTHTMYRRRTELDTQLCEDLLNLSVSSYAIVRM